MNHFTSSPTIAAGSSVTPALRRKSSICARSAIWSKRIMRRSFVTSAAMARPTKSPTSRISRAPISLGMKTKNDVSAAAKATRTVSTMLPLQVQLLGHSPGPLARDHRRHCAV